MTSPRAGQSTGHGWHPKTTAPTGAIAHARALPAAPLGHSAALWAARCGPTAALSGLLSQDETNRVLNPSDPPASTLANVISKTA